MLFSVLLRDIRGSILFELYLIFKSASRLTPISSADVQADMSQTLLSVLPHIHLYNAMKRTCRDLPCKASPTILLLFPD